MSVLYQCEELECWRRTKVYVPAPEIHSKVQLFKFPLTQLISVSPVPFLEVLIVNPSFEGFSTQTTT